MSAMVTLKLRGPRQIDAADWMMGKPCPEEIDPAMGDWNCQGASVIGGVLSVPAHLLAEFIEEVEDGIVVTIDSAGTPEDDIDARAVVRAMEKIIEKLKEIS